MKKIKTVKIKEIDGSIGEESYAITADAKDVDMSNGRSVQETIGTININEDGNIATQLKNKISKNNIVDNLETSDPNKVLSANQGKVLGNAITTLEEKSEKKPYYFNTVADMKDAIFLKEGDIAIVLETDNYYEKYKIIESDTKISSILLNNKNLYAINISSEVPSNKYIQPIFGLNYAPYNKSDIEGAI